MAEILSDLIADRARRKQKRSKDLAQIIDPLASQQEMDAAQGVDVSSEGGSQPQLAEESVGMASSMPIMAGGGSKRGGGGNQESGESITTAAGSNATAQPMTQTGGCANGRCGIGTQFSSRTYFCSPTVISSPITTTTVQPAPTVVSSPVTTTAGPVDADSLMGRGVRR